MASLSWSEFAKAIEAGRRLLALPRSRLRHPFASLCRVRNPAKVLADHWRPDLNVQYMVSPDAVIAASEGR